MHDDHQMGWPKAKEFSVEMKLTLLDTSPMSPFGRGYAAQQDGVPLGDGRQVFPDDLVKSRQWTMGWGASFADNGASGIKRFASGGILTGEAYMPLSRPSENAGQFCVVAPYSGRNWYPTLEQGVAHGNKLMRKPGQNASKLIVAKAVRVIEHETPPTRVRMPKPGEFA